MLTIHRSHWRRGVQNERRGNGALVRLYFSPPSRDGRASLLSFESAVPGLGLLQDIEMELPSTSSFTPLATLSLSSPYVLHPDACNPRMDLVVLLGPLEGSGPSLSSGIPDPHSATRKGKGKVQIAGLRTRVALWRLSGSKVWEVDLEGKVAGLAWNQDGERPLPCTS